MPCPIGPVPVETLRLYNIKKQTQRRLVYEYILVCTNMLITTAIQNIQHETWIKRNMGLSEPGNWIAPPLPSLYLMCTTFSNGCHGSHNDEERSEMRYVMRIAGPRESSKFWTHIVLPGYAWLHARLSVLVPHLTVMQIYFCISTSEYDIAMGQPWLYLSFLSLTAKINTTPPLVLSFFLCLCRRAETW